MAIPSESRGAPARPLRRPPRWVVDVVAGSAVVGAAIAKYPMPEFRPQGAIALVAVLLPAALLPLRHRHPVLALAGCIALYGVAAWQETLSPGAGLATAICMFTLATRASRRTTLIGAAVTAIAMVALSVYAARATGFDPRVFQAAVTMAFAAAAGDAVKSRRAHLAALTERAERAEQTREAEARRRVTEERLRIARDLHDAVAHQISVISLNAGVASETLERRPERAQEALSTIRTASRTVLREISDLLQLLRADDNGDDAPARPQPGLARIGALTAQFEQAGLAVTLRTDGDLQRVADLTGVTDLVAYRIIQEGLTNAHKHGSEQRAHVLVDVADGEIRITVTNPVAHRAARTADHAETLAGGHGLLGLRERVAAVRGSMETGVTPGGFRLFASLPLSRTALPTGTTPKENTE